MAMNVAGAVMVTACSHSRALDRRLGKISPSLGFAEARTASTERDLYQGIIDARLELLQRAEDSLP